MSEQTQRPAPHQAADHLDREPAPCVADEADGTEVSRLPSVSDAVAAQDSMEGRRVASRGVSLPPSPAQCPSLAALSEQSDLLVDPFAEPLAIAELCQLAGQPERIVSFLASGVNAQQVRRALLESRAQRAEITSAIDPDAGFQAGSADQGPLMAAVKKLS